MSTTKEFWSKVQGDLYVGFIECEKGGKKIAGSAFDPTQNRDDVQSFYADLIVDGENVLILVLSADENQVHIKDVTFEIHKEVNAYLQARGDDALPEFVSASLPEAFFTDITRWADGEFGVMHEYAAPGTESVIREKFKEFVLKYGDKPGNAEIESIIILVKNKDGVWNINDMGFTQEEALSVDETDYGIL